MPKNYREAAEELFAVLPDFFDDLACRTPDLDADWLEDNVFSIAFENGNTILITRHESSEEIWLAAPCGGFHFHWENNAWVDSRSPLNLGKRLSECLKLAGQIQVVCPF